MLAQTALLPFPSLPQWLLETALLAELSLLHHHQEPVTVSAFSAQLYHDTMPLTAMHLERVSGYIQNGSSSRAFLSQRLKHRTHSLLSSRGVIRRFSQSGKDVLCC